MPEVSFFYETRDLIDGNKLAARANRKNKRLWLLFAFGELLFILLFTITAEPSNRYFTFKVVTCISILGAIPLYLLAQRVSAEVNGRLALKAQPVLREEFTFEIRPNHFVQRSKHGDTIAEWSDIKYFSEDKNSFLMYPKFLPRRFYLLPKSKLTPEFSKALGENLQAADVPRR